MFVGRQEATSSVNHRLIFVRAAHKFAEPIHILTIAVGLIAMAGCRPAESAGGILSLLDGGPEDDAGQDVALSVTDSADDPADDVPGDVTLDAGTDEGPVGAAVGTACGHDADCASGFCVEGVCCNSACNGSCLTCSAAGNPGHCQPAAAGSDPRNDCPDDGASTCGRDGFCDGTGKCRSYQSGTMCSPAACTGSSLTVAGACNGAGTCVMTPAQSCAPYLCGANAACATTCAANNDCATPAVCSAGACGGLRGEYFSMMDLTMSVLVRTDATVNFNWGLGSPAAGLPVDGFSIRWTGTVTPRFTETYTFSTIADDGSRLWINGMELVNDWSQHAARQVGGTIDLQAGKPVSLTLEYFDQVMAASVQLLWSSKSEPEAIIPTSALAPAP